MVEVSFLEKPALAMNLQDFVDGLNFERLRNSDIEQVLEDIGVKGDVTPNFVYKIKSKTFNSAGTLTIEGLMDIFHDLKKGGLPRHTTVRGYMSCVAQAIKKTA